MRIPRRTAVLLSSLVLTGAVAACGGGDVDQTGPGIDEPGVESGSLAPGVGEPDIEPTP